MSDKDKIKQLENQLEILLKDETPTTFWKGHRHGYKEGMFQGFVLGVCITILVILALSSNIIFF